MSTSRAVARRAALLLAAEALAFSPVVAAQGHAAAAWSASSQGQAESVALTMPPGRTPTARASSSSVLVMWSATAFPGGTTVEGYTVQRYQSGVPGAMPVNANCSGLVTSTSCTENGVPSGTWTYTVIPIQGGWHGAESPQSNSVTI